MDKHSTTSYNGDACASYYIIHAGEDDFLASEIRRELHQLEDTVDTASGEEPTPNFVLEPLPEAELVLVLCSKASSSSEKVRLEVEQAIKLQKLIFSAELEKGSIPEHLRDTELLDLTKLNRDKNFKEDQLPARGIEFYWALLPFIRAALPGSGRTSTQEFLSIWGALNLPERIIFALFPIVLTYLFVWLLPSVGAVFIKREFSSASYNLRVKFHVPEQKMSELDGELKFEVPKVIKISETRPVAAELKSDRKQLTGWVPAAKLDSPSFDFTPIGFNKASVKDDTFTWGWLVSPKQLGQHALSFQIENINGIVPNDGIQSPDLRVTGASLVALITVVNDLGLTSEQEYILKGIGALIGVIGTILSYPLWKRFFERKLVRSGRRKAAKATPRNKPDKAKRR